MYKNGQVKEYRDLNESEFAKSSVIMSKSGKDQHGIKRDYSLIHFTAGFRIAGSCATYRKESYLVRFLDNSGSSHGQYYNNELDAINAFYEKTANLA